VVAAGSAAGTLVAERKELMKLRMIVLEVFMEWRLGFFVEKRDGEAFDGSASEPSSASLLEGRVDCNQRAHGSVSGREEIEC
jgi:hypothetical protein